MEAAITLTLRIHGMNTDHAIIPKPRSCATLYTSSRGHGKDLVTPKQWPVTSSQDQRLMTMLTYSRHEPAWAACARLRTANHNCQPVLPLLQICLSAQAAHMCFGGDKSLTEVIGYAEITARRHNV